MTLRVPRAREEAAVAAFWESGCLGVSAGVVMPGDANGGWPDETREPCVAGPRGAIALEAYFPGARRRGDLRRALARSWAEARLGRMSHVSFRRAFDERWVEAWQKTLRPMPIGRRILALPEGCPPRRAGRRIVLHIPFGQAFGTGEHASTRLSLLLLESALRTRDRVIDLGTGTGILALAARRLGAGSVLGVDDDPVAIAVAKKTRRLNAVRTGLVFRHLAADAALTRAARTGARYDVALVNIGARVIASLLPGLAGAVAPGGRVILAGILTGDEADLLRSAATLGLRPAARRRSRPWSALLLVRTGRASRQSCGS